MIKVLQILPGINRGGLETFVMNIYRSIDRSRIQFEFLTNMQEGDYRQEILELGGIIHYLPSRREGYSRYLRNLQDFFSSHKGYYNAVHYHESSLTSLEPLYFAKKIGIPIRIMHSHNSMVKGNRLHLVMHMLGKLFIRNLATNYLGCSDKAIKWMYGGTGIKNKAVLIANGVDTCSFAFNTVERKKVRDNLNLSDKKIIGHVGRFSEVKNHRFLLEIFVSILRKDPSFHLILIGTGELENGIKKRAVELGIAEHVSFLGLRSDINSLMQAMDVFVMPSFYEGLPVVLVEAQTSGLPIVCSDTISLMSRIIPEYYICSLNDTPDIWADKILNALSFNRNRAESKNIVAQAGFDIESTCQQLSTIYSSK